MNRIYRTIWNPRTGTTVAVAETTKTRGKAAAGGGGLALGLRPLVAALAMAGLAQAATPAVPPTSTQLPTGGSVVAGTASIASTVTTSSASMTITQSSQRAVVDWTRFDVGSAA